MVNLSDGVKDGFALFFIKDGKLCSVLLTKDQAKLLDISLSVVFTNEKARILPADSNVIKKLSN